MVYLVKEILSANPALVYTSESSIDSAASNDALKIKKSIIHDSMTVEQFRRRFDCEEACADYLFQVKWPAGYICPRCSFRYSYKTTSRRLPLFECARCRHQTSLTVGTIMEKSRTDLRKWFSALFLVTRNKGINAVKLSELIKVTYKTAWLMLHKIRHSMSSADAEVLLAGFVRVNRAKYGNPYNSSIYRHPQEQLLLLGASMNERDEPIYVKIRRIPEDFLDQHYIRRWALEAFIEENVEPGCNVESVIKWTKRNLYHLYPLNEQANQFINDTYHGIGPRHLQAYLNEYCCRLNYCLRQAPFFEALVQICVTYKTITYSSLTAPPPKSTRKLIPVWFNQKSA